MNITTASVLSIFAETQYSLAIDTEGTHFLVRLLTAADADMFRAIRLEALYIDGRFFVRPDREESQLTIQEWTERLQETADQCWFGLYADDELIGISHVYRSSINTAEARSMYIRKKYRRKGLSDLFVHAHLEWLRQKPWADFVEFHVRADNMPSRNLCEDHLKGIRIEKIDAIYGDRSTGPAYLYRIDLRNWNVMYI